MLKKIFRLFKREMNQNELLIKNMNAYEQKKKAEQQQSEVLASGQKRRTKNKK
tara:strand:- start:374 stop:532 length:159 start_codon:yes stop_codon:yes gene_type:complete